MVFFKFHAEELDENRNLYYFDDLIFFGGLTESPAGLAEDRPQHVPLCCGFFVFRRDAMNRITTTRQRHAAVFLDRDGTLIHDGGYLRRPRDVVFYEETFPALRALQTRFMLFVVTNQSGIAKGLQSPEEVKTVNRFVEERLRREGILLRKTYTCPHAREEGCRCIKPNPFFAHQSARDFDLCLSSSYAVGDHPHDVEFGRGFGGTGLYVLTGHGKKHLKEWEKTGPVFPSLSEAATWILQRPGRSEDSE